MANRPITDFAQNILKPYINNQDKAYAANIAPVETSPATSAHTAGTQIIYNGVLYDVTADINANDALATTGAGANIAAADDVSEQISNVKQALSDYQEVCGSKNLFDSYISTVTNHGGVTLTKNADGSISYSGQALSIPFGYRIGTIKLKAGQTYKLTGAVDNNHYLNLFKTGVFDIYDRGSGATVTITEDLEAILSVIINDSAVLSGTFYPMVRLANIGDDIFEPYVPTNSQLLSYKDNGVLGAKNFVGGKFTTGVNNGITYTANANGSVSFSGTIGSQNDYSLADSAVFTLKAGTYILSSNPVPGSGTHRSTVRLFISGGSSVVTLSTETEGMFTLASDSNVYIRIAFNGTGQSYSGTFYPMIRLATDTDPTYQPYAMTNKELTDARFLNGKLGGVSTDNFTSSAEFTIPSDNWYYLYLQTNTATSSGSLSIMLGSDYWGNTVAAHRNGGVQYESCNTNLPLKKGTKVIFKCTDTATQCQYQAIPIT